MPHEGEIFRSGGRFVIPAGPNNLLLWVIQLNQRPLSRILCLQRSRSTRLENKIWEEVSGVRRTKNNQDGFIWMLQEVPCNKIQKQLRAGFNYDSREGHGGCRLVGGFCVLNHRSKLRWEISRMHRISTVAMFQLCKQPKFSWTASSQAQRTKFQVSVSSLIRTWSPWYHAG